MRQKITILVCLLCSTFFVFGQTDTLRLSLDSCIAYAMKNNVTMRGAELQRQQSAVALEAAILRFTPTLSASVAEDVSIFSGNVSPSANMGAGSSLNLFNGLSDYNNYRKSKVQSAQSEYEWQKSGDDISIQIIGAYLDIITNQERQIYLQRVLESAQRQLTDGEAKMQAGTILQSDYQMLDASLRRAQCDVDNANISIAINRTKLRNLLGVEPNVAIDALPLAGEDTMAFVLPELSALIEKATTEMPDIHISQLEVQKAQYDLKIAKGGYYPSLGLNVYASMYGGDNQRTDGSGFLITNGELNTNISLSLSIPIFQQGMNRTQVKQGQIALQQAIIRQEETRRQIAEAVEERYYSALQSSNNYAASLSMMQANEETYNVMQAKFRAGSIGTVELLRQQESYLNSLNDYLQNKFTYLLSIKILKIYMGMYH